LLASIISRLLQQLKRRAPHYTVTAKAQEKDAVRAAPFMFSPQSENVMDRTTNTLNFHTTHVVMNWMKHTQRKLV